MADPIVQKLEELCTLYAEDLKAKNALSDIKQDVQRLLKNLPATLLLTSGQSSLFCSTSSATMLSCGLKSLN